MINKLKSFINTEDKKRLLSNFISLAALQGANYILPLITLPYLVRVLGVEYFGLLAFATATITYFQIITDYGFNLTATREISIHRTNKEKVIEVFSSVMIIKFVLMIVSFILLCTLVFSFEKFRANYEIYLLTFGMVVGQVLFPVWFFQGMERMKYITYINIGSKVAFTLAIFVFVKSQSEYWLVPLLNSLGVIVGGIYAIHLVKKNFNITFAFQNKSTLKIYMKDGWDVFLSRIYVNIYTTTNIVLLGLLTNNTVVGYYSVAEKIVSAISGLYVPVNQALYPFFAKVYTQSKSRFYKLFSKFNVILLVSSIVLTICAYLIGEYAIKLVAGEFDKDIYVVYSILMMSIITAPFGSSFTNGLLVIRENKLVSKVVRDTMILNLIFILPLIYYYQAPGLATVFIVVQFFHVLYYLFSYRQVIALRASYEQY